MAEVGDEVLLARARSGEDAAFAELYRRHAAAVRSHARLCCRDPHTAEDLAAEVFARTLRALRAGAGPRDSARAYLLTTVRRLAAQWSTGRGAAEQPVADVGEQTAAHCASEAQALSRADRSMAVRAFHRLPDRWQEVLWHTAVEEEPLSKVAPLLGLSRNAAAVLAFRAREGLREAYLQEHVSAALAGEADCREHVGLLGAFARRPSRRRGFQRLRRHLDSCDRCRAAYAELLDLNATLRGLLPATLPAAAAGWFAATRLTGGASLAASGAGLGTGAGAGVGLGAGAGAGGALGKLAVGATLALATGAVVTGSAPLTAPGGVDRPPAVSQAPQPPGARQEGGGLADSAASPSRGPSGRPGPTASGEERQSAAGDLGEGTGEAGDGGVPTDGEEREQGGPEGGETARAEAAEEPGGRLPAEGSRGRENGNQGRGQGEPGAGNQGQGNGAQGNGTQGNGTQGNGRGNGNRGQGNGNQGTGNVDQGGGPSRDNGNGRANGNGDGNRGNGNANGSGGRGQAQEAEATAYRATAEPGAEPGRGEADPQAAPERSGEGAGQTGETAGGAGRDPQG